MLKGVLRPRVAASACVRSARRGHFGGGGRPILHQRIEAAARRDDIDEVRRLLKEHDMAAAAISRRSGPPSIASQAFFSVAVYCGWNFLASAYDYRVAGSEAAGLLAEGSEFAEVTMKLKSFSLSAEVSTRGRASSHPFWDNMPAQDALTRGDDHTDTHRVRVFPHIFLSDFVFGRSRWLLKCRKEAGRTEWHTEPAE